MGFRNIFVKDESTQLNGTFKDRLSLKALKHYPEGTTFGVISYGNTAVSLVRLNLEAGLYHRVVVFVPEGFEDWLFGPSTSNTVLQAKTILNELKAHAEVVPVNLTSKVLTDNDLYQLALAHEVKITNFVNVTEGLNIPAYVDIIKEVIEQLGYTPDICIVPFGAGILCNETKDYLESIGHGVVIPISVSSPASIARMLYGPIWVDTKELQNVGIAYSRHRSPDLTGRSREPYPVFLVREEEINEGLKIARNIGISAEPSGSAGFGILARLNKIYPLVNPDNDTVVIINTGNGIDGFLR
jgi:threonine dehydratase